MRDGGPDRPWPGRGEKEKGAWVSLVECLSHIESPASKKHGYRDAALTTGAVKAHQGPRTITTLAGEVEVRKPVVFIYPLVRASMVFILDQR